MKRTVLLDFSDVNDNMSFRIERWWFPLDHEVESLTRIALVWSPTDDDAAESVVLLGPARVKEVINALADHTYGKL